jgi:glucose-6-phosphate 1-epimerase
MSKKFFMSLSVALFMGALWAGVVELKTTSACCRVDPEGARVISFRVGDDELLWNDRPPQKNAADWAHGGIPICWPVFGIDSAGKIHGFAWRRPFRILKRSESSELSVLVMELQDGDVRLEWSATLAETLTLEMTTENAGTNLYKCSYGYHPYFLVGERNCCTVDGVDGLSFEDDPSVADRKSGIWHGIVGLKAEIDRIFALSEKSCRVFTLRDIARARTIKVRCEGATHLNIWNPGAAKNCPGSVPSDEWRRFVCVEPIALAVKVPPQGRKTLRMTVEVEKMPCLNGQN